MERNIGRARAGRLKGRMVYLVAWTEQDYSCHTWEPERNLRIVRQDGCQQTLVAIPT